MAQIGSKIRINTVVTSDRKIEDLPVASVPLIQGSNIKGDDLLYLFHVICTTSFSMSSASPFSRGSAIMVILFLSITSHSCQSLILRGGRRDSAGGRKQL